MSQELLLRSIKLPWPLFSPDSAWNQSVVETVVQAQSTDVMEMMLSFFIEKGISPVIWVSHEDYTFPIFRMTSVAEGISDLRVLSYRGDEWPPDMLPWYKAGNGHVFARGVPRSATDLRPSGPNCLDSDGSLVLFNAETGEEYDFWQATTALDETGASLGGGQIGSNILRTGGIAYFKTDGLGAQLPICDARSTGTLPRASARATGVPYLAGLLIPEDLAEGADSIISHALAFAAPRLRHIPCATLHDPPDYVYPATRTETKFFSRYPLALAAGQRLRLKARILDDAGVEIDESHANSNLVPITRIFLRALREYGAYLVDGGRGFAFSAEDYHTAFLDLDERQVNELIGAPPHQLLPLGLTKWQVVLDKLNEQLSWEAGGGMGHGISLAVEMPDSSYRPNFELVQDALTPDVNWQRHVAEDGDIECP